MPELSLKRMDATLQKIVGNCVESCLDLEDAGDVRLAINYAAQDGYFAGMRDAAKIAWQAGIDDPKYPTGHARDAIRAAISRLKREVKNVD